jgi:hypothetical protein
MHHQLQQQTWVQTPAHLHHQLQQQAGVQTPAQSDAPAGRGCNLQGNPGSVAERVPVIVAVGNIVIASRFDSSSTATADAAQQPQCSGVASSTGAVGRAHQQQQQQQLTMLRACRQRCRMQQLASKCLGRNVVVSGQLSCPVLVCTLFQHLLPLRVVDVQQPLVSHAAPSLRSSF